MSAILLALREAARVAAPNERQQAPDVFSKHVAKP